MPRRPGGQPDALRNPKRNGCRKSQCVNPDFLASASFQTRIRTLARRESFAHFRCRRANPPASVGGPSSSLAAAFALVAPLGERLQSALDGTGRVLELVEALDTSLRAGGRLPCDWAR